MYYYQRNTVRKYSECELVYSYSPWCLISKQLHVHFLSTRIDLHYYRTKNNNYDMDTVQTQTLVEINSISYASKTSALYMQQRSAHVHYSCINLHSGHL